MYFFLVSLIKFFAEDDIVLRLLLIISDIPNLSLDFKKKNVLKMYEEKAMLSPSKFGYKDNTNFIPKGLN